MLVIHTREIEPLATEFSAEETNRLLKQNKVFSFLLFGPDGCGKTSLLEKTVAYFTNLLSLAVIQIDNSPVHDAKRFEQFPIQVIQIETDVQSSLSDEQFASVISHINLPDIRLLCIERTGNIFNSAATKLGEEIKVLVLSLCQGEEIPLKYSSACAAADVLIISKLDLAPYLECTVDMIRENALMLNPKLVVFEISAASGQGLQEWCHWLILQSGKYA